jgi:hypothetical protein
MNPEDQARYAGDQPGDLSQLPPIEEHEPKIPILERDEQRTFSRWCRKHDLGDSMIWHSTAHRTKGTRGCPDFVLPVNGLTLYIEFKLPGNRLSPDQEAFRVSLDKQRTQLHVVHSADEAISLVEPLLLTTYPQEKAGQE